MKNYLKIFAPVGLVILFGSLTFVFAQTKTGNEFPKGERREAGRMPPFGFAPGGIDPRALDQLNLTDEQKKQIRTVRENAHAASKVYFEKLQVVQEKIKDTTESESFDEAEARRLLKTRGEIQTELEIIRLKADSAVFNLLTAEQIARLDLLKSQRPERPEFPPQQ
jgi:Spy/CpxP family protein refolding chaperone